MLMRWVQGETTGRGVLYAFGGKEIVSLPLPFPKSPSNSHEVHTYSTAARTSCSSARPSPCLSALPAAAELTSYPAPKRDQLAPPVRRA